MSPAAAVGVLQNGEPYYGDAVAARILVNLRRMTGAGTGDGHSPPR